MKLTSSHLDDLSSDIAREQDVILDGRVKDTKAKEAAKRRLRSTGAPSRSKSSKLVPFVALAAALVLVVGGALFRARTQPLAFRVGDAPGDVGGWVRAPADAPVDLRFSDASAITLDASGRARVVDVDANGARVVLESGLAHVSITHRQASRWHIVAGPFDVVVTGTEFDVAWDPATEHFSVQMKQGTVHVLGTLLGEGHALSTGGALDVSVPEGVVRQTEGGSPPIIDAPTGSAAAPNGTFVVETKSDGGVASSPKSSTLAIGDSAHAPSTAPVWALLAQNGDYQKAVETAEKSGFGDACDQAKVRDVLALGDAARFTGHTDEAHRAYAAVRNRSPGDPAAAEAAFDLGRVAFDREHDYVAAASWFDTYGHELPNGPLAREAAGRVIEARQRSGDRIGLTAAAQSYLQKYPDGPHADLARSIVTP